MICISEVCIYLSSSFGNHSNMYASDHVRMWIFPDQSDNVLFYSMYFDSKWNITTTQCLPPICDITALLQPVSTWSSFCMVSMVLPVFFLSSLDVQQRRVLCKACLEQSTSQGNTTSLYQYLKEHPRQLYDECIAKKSNESSDAPVQSSKQPTISELFVTVTP